MPTSTAPPFGALSRTLDSFTSKNRGARVVICDPTEAKRFVDDRRTHGLREYDEVWNGVRIVMPLANLLHQEIVAMFVAIIRGIFGVPGPHQVTPGVNVSDRTTNWTENYRCPDVSVYLDSTAAINCGTHWCGGPDFLTEIISEGDPSREKLPFYESINTREVLIVDRDPWQLELYQLNNGKLVLTATSTLDDPKLLISSVLPLTFRLVPGPDRPRIEVAHQTTNQIWLV